VQARAVGVHREQTSPTQNDEVIAVLFDDPAFVDLGVL
jgi:hypothetical protein